MMKTRTIALTMILTACGATSAMAAPQFTTVNAPPAGEKSHGYILGQIYGGSFTKSGRDYSNSLLTAQRLADSGAAATSLSNPTSGLSADNAWIGPASTIITAEAKYAAHNSTFGYYDDTKANPTFIPIFNTSSFDQPKVIEIPAAFRWAIKNNTTGRIFTSNPNNNIQNGQKLDQLVTYKMNGMAPGINEWVLFWEDLTPNDCSDYDYNDSAITIRTFTNVPTPGTAALLGAGCVLMRRRKRS